MTNKFLCCAVLFVLAAFLQPAFAQAQGKLSVSSAEVQVEGEIVNVIVADMNGDKLPDLVVFYRPPAAKEKDSTTAPESGTGVPPVKNHGQDAHATPRRPISVAVFPQDKANGFAGAKPEVFPLPEGTIAYCIGNFSASAGDEVVALDSRGAVLVQRDASSSAGGQRIVEESLFFPEQEGREPFSWFWPEDINNDGLQDLVLPRKDGYAVCYLAAESGTGVPPVKNHGQDAHATTGGTSARRQILKVPVATQLSGSAAGEISFDRSMPIPTLADFDGDGRKDAVFLSGASLLVFLQDGEGVFPSEPSLRLPGEFHRSREGVGRIVNAALWTNDVNHDRRVDVVAFVSEGALARLENVTSSVLLFLGRGREGYRTTPDCIINLRGMLVTQWVGDFNGDGNADLMVASVKTDFMSALAKHVSKQTLVEYAIHLFDPAKGAFVAEPSYLGQERVVPPKRDGVSGMLAQFQADFDGDHVSDRFGMREKDGKRTLYVRRGRIGAKPNTMTFEKQPMLEQAIEGQGWPRLADVNGDGLSDVLFQNRSSVVVLTTKR